MSLPPVSPNCSLPASILLFLLCAFLPVPAPAANGDIGVRDTIMSRIDSGSVHIRAGNYTAALRLYFEALREADRARNDTLIAKAHSALGTAYYRMREYDRAIAHLHTAMLTFDRLKDQMGLANAFYKMGAVYQDMPEPEYKTQALPYLRKALSLYKTQGSCLDLADAYNGLAGYYYMQRQTDSVAFFAKLALEMYEKCGTPDVQAAMYTNIAALLNSQKKHEEAVSYNLQAIRIARENSLYAQLSEGYKNLSETYSYMGDYRNAYENALLYHQYKDSLISTNKTKEMEELSALYESEKKEKVIAEKETEIARTRQRGTALTLSTLFALLLSAMLFFLYYQRRKQNERLVEMNATKGQAFLDHFTRPEISGSSPEAGRGKYARKHFFVR